MNKTLILISWVLRIITAIILLQTLYFKFSGAPESVYIFTTIGMEPVGRIGSGVVELISSILLLLPRTVWIGAIIALGTMCGAIFFHLTTLGVEVEKDGGLLLALAVIVAVASMMLLVLHRSQLPFKLLRK